MKANEKKRMVLSQTPDGRVWITAYDVDRFIRPGETDTDLARLCRVSPGSITEIHPMTQAAIDDFCSRHGGTLLYESLAAYPYPGS